MPGVWTPTAKSNAHQLAHPHDNRQTLCLAIVILMLVIDILATAIRLACRRKLKARLSYDDYAIIIATVRTACRCTFLLADELGAGWLHCAQCNNR